MKPTQFCSVKFCFITDSPKERKTPSETSVVSWAQIVRYSYFFKKFLGCLTKMWTLLMVFCACGGDVPAWTCSSVSVQMWTLLMVFCACGGDVPAWTCSSVSVQFWVSGSSGHYLALPSTTFFGGDRRVGSSKCDLVALPSATATSPEASLGSTRGGARKSQVASELKWEWEEVEVAHHVVLYILCPDYSQLHGKVKKASPRNDAVLWHMREGEGFTGTQLGEDSHT